MREIQGLAEIRFANCAATKVLSGAIVDLQDATLLHAFLRRVQVTPEAVAAVDHLRQASYAELDRLSKKVHAALLEAGVGRGAIVALSGERSVSFLAGILGIWRAGAVYLPMDPSTPPARRRYMLERAGCTTLLADRETIATLAEVSPFGVRIDLDAACCAPEPKQALELRTDPNAPAYVIFTSGSMGTPKGAQVHHRGMLNHLTAKVRDLGLTERDVVAQLAPISFDISLWQFLAPLLAGGRLIVFSDALAHDPDALLAALEAHGVTVLEVVPSLLKSVLASGAVRERVAMRVRLRWLVLTGEALPPSLCRAWLERFPDVPLVNAYGPSECSDDVTHGMIRIPPPADVASVPIGRPICNVRLYVLRQTSAGLQLCEPGVPGELWIAGACVGLGYINDPAATRAAFYRLVHEDGTSSILYRSGDLVSADIRGTLWFHGKLDRQLEIRGQRVELGEVEAQLLAHPGVRDAIAVAQTPAGQRPYESIKREGVQRAESAVPGRALVAYVTCGAGVTAESLRAHLSAHLPGYMIPDHFFLLDALPLMRNGKVDVRALPLPARGSRATPANYVPPASDNERAIAFVWQELLGVEPVGVEDSFIALGGDSLLAMQAVNRLRRALHAPVEYADLMTHSTLREVARRVDALRARLFERKSAGVEQAPRSRLPPATHGQQALWSSWQLAPHDPCHSFQVAVRLSGPLNVDVFCSACRLVVAENVILRTSFVWEAGTLYLKSPETAHDLSSFPVPIHRLTRLSAVQCEQALHELAQQAIEKPFDLTSVPLLRLALVCLRDEEHVLLLTAHETILDAWGAGVLLRLLDDAYLRCLAGDPTPETSLRPQFAEYARWESEMQVRFRSTPARDYWTTLLAGDLPRLSLPFDQTPSSGLSHRGASLEAELSPELRTRIEQLCGEQRCTLSVWLLTAYFVTLAVYSNQADLVVGVPFANRVDERSEEMLGNFLNLLPVRLQLSSDLTVRQLVSAIGEQLTQSISNASYPFQCMVQDARAAADSSRTPIFQVFFDMLHIPPSTAGASPVRMKFQNIERGYYKYELNLHAHSSDEGVFLRLSYLTALFKASTAEALLLSLQSALRIMTETPFLPLSEVMARVVAEAPPELRARVASLPPPGEEKARVGLRRPAAGLLA
ncbi:MAG TPA: amino acid adenylation domain-containing protein [Polyangiaceae bacterium]|nr:amino acid adenylation domain-containing protein [Polyangiaceae bacterium]